MLGSECCRAAVLVALTFAVPTLAHAQSSSSSSSASTKRDVRILYSAPSSCADAAPLVRELSARDPSWRFVTDKEGADDPQPLELRVSIDRSPSGFLGAVRLRDHGALVAERSVDGSECPEVLSGLVFLCALALSDRDSAVAAQPAPPTPAPQPDRVDQAPPRRSFFLGASGEATLSTAISRSLRPGASAYLETGSTSSGIWSPLVRVGGSFIDGGTIDTAIGPGSTRLIAGRADICPIRFGFSERAEMRPCLGFEIGDVSAEGEANVPNAHRESALWLAAGGGLRGQWRAGGPLHLYASAGAVFPLIRHRFFFRPGTTLFTPEVVAPMAALGASVRFF